MKVVFCDDSVLEAKEVRFDGLEVLCDVEMINGETTTFPFPLYDIKAVKD